MNMMNPNASSALTKSLAEAKARLQEKEQEKMRVIADSLTPRMPAPRPQIVKNVPPPPVPKPRTVVCKDERCELPGRLFIPEKATYELCPACSRRRKEEAQAKREEEQRLRDEIAQIERETKRTERLIADFKAGKAFACTDEGCTAIEHPGSGYNPDLPFHCFKHREEYRQRKTSGQIPRTHRVFAHHVPVPATPVVEDTATRAKKRFKAEAEELFRAGGEASLPKGVSLHQRLDRQITLKFVSEGETFYHNFVLAISNEEKRAKDAAAQKRRLDNRQRIDEPKKGNHKNEGKKSRK